MRYALVTTTIHVPKLLDSYAKDARAYGHDVLFSVVGDKKTPPETVRYCEDLAKRENIAVEYFSPQRQEKYLARFPALQEHFPWNSIQRRNVGMLFAYESGCDTIITIDDDNFRVTNDYISAHGVGAEQEVISVESSTGWMSVGKLLSEKHGRTFYHRGFPLEKRISGETWKETSKKARIVVNAGLWLGDPDVDALERLYHLTEPTESVALAREGRFAPARDTWTPFNSQNTALHRDVIPAYFLSPLIGRYDDIWASYIVKRIVDHLGDSISFGEPLVRQERNPHDYWKDLEQERYGHRLTMRFVEGLASLSLKGRSYKGCFAELTDMLPRMSAQEGLTDNERAFLEGLFKGMRVWRDVFSTLT
jgi:hypothetical protein